MHFFEDVFDNVTHFFLLNNHLRDHVFVNIFDEAIENAEMATEAPRYTALGLVPGNIALKPVAQQKKDWEKIVFGCDSEE